MTDFADYHIKQHITIYIGEVLPPIRRGKLIEVVPRVE